MFCGGLQDLNWVKSKDMLLKPAKDVCVSSPLVGVRFPMSFRPCSVSSISPSAFMLTNQTHVAIKLAFAALNHV
jgi:hypothetical protein